MPGDRRRLRLAGPRSPWPITPAASTKWPGGCDQREVMTRYAVPGPPVQLPNGHTGAAGVPQHGGVAVRAVIDNAQPTAGPQDPHRLAQRLCPPADAPDAADRQAADYRVGRRGRKREVTRVRIDHFHLVAHALGRRVAFCGGPAVAILVAAAPDVCSHRPAGGRPPASAPRRGRTPRPGRARRRAGPARQAGPPRSPACLARWSTGNSPPTPPPLRLPRRPARRRRACDGALPRPRCPPAPPLVRQTPPALRICRRCRTWPADRERSAKLPTSVSEIASGAPCSSDDARGLFERAKERANTVRLRATSSDS